VPVAGGLSFRQLTAGSAFTCGLIQTGEAYCWGNNTAAQTGNTSTSTITPVPVQGGNRFTMISSGAKHTCGVATDGRVLCWGATSPGEPGGGASTLKTYVPFALNTPVTFRSVASGGDRSCAISTSGDAYCWPADLGTTPARAPIQVPGGVKFSRLALPESTTCGIAEPSSVLYCWDGGPPTRVTAP
jgi:alpha-tubulin suppressor-like RCC1 family protein